MSTRVRYKQEEPPPPRTGSSRDKWRRTLGLEHPGWSKQQEQRGEDQAGGAAANPDWIIQGQVAADAPDWIIRGGASSRSGRVRYKQKELPPPRTGSSRYKWRRAPRT